MYVSLAPVLVYEYCIVLYKHPLRASILDVSR